MREIKFKIWADDRFYDKCLVGNTTNVNDDKWTCPLVWLEDRKEWVHCDNGIICEFTGLHDKNGKEIYEGDIVKINNDVASMFNIKSTGKVEYNNGLFLVRNGDEIGILSSLFILADTKYCLRGEVIGNIYENSDLLKGADNVE